MKRFLVLFLMLSLACTSSLAEPWRVFDNARLFSAEDNEAIEQAVSKFQRETNMDFVVLTTDDYLGKKTPILTPNGSLEKTTSGLAVRPVV